MLKFNVVRDKQGQISYIETGLTEYDLLGDPRLNKGCAFTHEERSLFNLEGLLPYRNETLAQQVSRMYVQYQEHRSNLGKNIYLNVLHDYNQTLFYKLASEHLEEMLPILYTPTVGEAVERFSLELRKPYGLYISYEERDQMEKIIENSISPYTNLIVVSDGEAVLGIGDQGIGGIKICNAKLMVYTLCANINPYCTLPIQLDTGTNNPNLLADPMYLGWRHERITGPEYDDFIDQFVTTLQKKLPYVYLHWEDFGKDNARRILTHYREKICTINGDMQSTGAVALACVLAGCIASGIPLKDHRIVILGAGTAGVGIADQIASAMQRQGLSATEAHKRFWLIDKEGLLVDNQTHLAPYQKPYARSEAKNIGLQDVIQQVKPTILIGCSTVGGAFTEEIVKIMASEVKNPIIMPLSNPTTKSEAKPEDLLKWTEGRAIIATGSPFPEVLFDGKTIRISQSNNAYAFPGIGLGAIASKAKKLTDSMLWAATQALSNCSPVLQDPTAPVLPRLANMTSVSYQVALAVAKQAREEGLAGIPSSIDLNQAIQQVTWVPEYYPYKLK